MKKVLFPITALILLLCLVPVLAAPAAATWTGNLLQNPGAETGDMTGWTSDLGVDAIPSLEESCGTVLPNSESYFFTMGPDGTASPASMEQEIDLTILGGIPVTFEAGGWVQTEWYWEPGWPDTGTDPGPGNYDYGALHVEFFDDEGGTLGVFTLDPVENPVCLECGVPHTYAAFSLTDDVPDGAVTAVYKLEGYRMQRIYINVFYDDLYFSVDVAPPPTPTPTATPSPTPTATPPPPVGGTIIPTDKPGLVMPWIAAGALIVAAGVSLAIWNRKRGGERASDR